MFKKEKKLSIEEMLLLSISSALKGRTKCTFGEIVKESFILFPKVFSLSQFPNWPDSLKLDRQLRKLREKGLITGSPITYYSLTKFGYNVVNQLKFQIKGKKGVDTPVKNPTRDPDLTFLKAILRSEEFHKFLKDSKNYKPDNMRIREITKFPLETPNKVVSRFLNHLAEVAKKRKEENLVKFLSLCSKFIVGNEI